MFTDSIKSKFIKKLRSVKYKKPIAILTIGLISLGFSVAGIIHYKQKKAEEQIAIYMHEIDNVVPVMTNLISLSDEILKYHETKAEDINAWTLSNLSTKLEDIATALTILKSNDPIVHNAISVTMTLQEAFDQESQLAIQREIALAAIQLNNTVDVKAIQAMRMQSMQNIKTINKAEKSLGNISYEFFYHNRCFLTDSEEKELATQINSLFEKPINKYNKSLKKLEDPAKITMHAYEWTPFYMYLALNS